MKVDSGVHGHGGYSITVLKVDGKHGHKHTAPGCAVDCACRQSSIFIGACDRVVGTGVQPSDGPCSTGPAVLQKPVKADGRLNSHTHRYRVADTGTVACTSSRDCRPAECYAELWKQLQEDTI